MESLLNPPLFDVASYQEQIRQFETRPELLKDRDRRNNYALALVYTGAAEKARDVWQAMETEQPGEYRIAANLGTAYELCGDNENALKWISAGLQRNPDSHFGTEWLHARILQAKLGLASDPQWLASNRVSGARHLLRGGAPVAFACAASDNLSQQVTLEVLRSALRYQLKERLKFIREPDPMVAQLLVDLGDAELLSHSPHTALLAYQRADDYQANSRVILDRIAAAVRAGRPAWQRNLAWLLAGGVLLVVAVIVLARGLRKRPSPAAQSAPGV